MKKTLFLWLTIGALALLLAACGPKATEAPTEAPVPTAEAPAEETVDVQAAFVTGGCGACHVIPGVPNAAGTIGPDLSEAGIMAAEQVQAADYNGEADNATDYLYESIVAPDAYIAPDCPGGPCQEGLMPSPSSALSDAELQAMAEYLVELKGGEVAQPSDTAAPAGSAPSMTDEEFSEAKQIFFDRCAGCHGVLRKGATGPALTPDVTLSKGTTALTSIIFNGTQRGMPDWGKQGVLTEAQAEMMAKYIQNEPPAPPEMSMEQMKETWSVIVPPDERPTEPQTSRDWQNYFVVPLRDAGQVAVIDGDTYEVVNTVDTGYAVHITRMSATGRYAYVIGRDGKVALVDLWMEKPDKVAEVQTCYDARSVDVSKYKGEEGDFFDKYAVVGCYWPPHFAILDGATLEPMKVVSTRSYTYDTGEYHPEPRVASIVASHFAPEWIINVKETGQVWLVDYSDPLNPTIKMLEAERFLHDGGWDASGRYFLVAANARDKVVVVDAQEEKVVAIVETGTKPHPGRGANFVDPEYGPVWCTGHIGEGLISCIGTDPEGHPDSAWKVVREIELPSAGSLFIKTHPNSQWIWVDLTLSTDETLQRSVCVIDKQNPTEITKCWEVSDYGRAVHFEYNKQGTEVWVSVWGRIDQPGQIGEIVVYDDATLEEIARIPDLPTPTGKFNVYNTVDDIY